MNAPNMSELLGGGELEFLTEMTLRIVKMEHDKEFLGILHFAPILSDILKEFEKRELTDENFNKGLEETTFHIEGVQVPIVVQTMLVALNEIERTQIERGIDLQLRLNKARARLAERRAEAKAKDLENDSDPFEGLDENNDIQA